MLALEQVSVINDLEQRNEETNNSRAREVTIAKIMYQL